MSWRLLPAVRRAVFDLGWPRPVRDEAVAAFLHRLLSRPGAPRFLTVRETLRSFVQALNVLVGNPELSPAEVLGRAEAEVAESRFVAIGEQP